MAVRTARLVVSTALTVLVSLSGAPGVGADDLTAVLDRVGERVERYYVRAQSIVALETVRIQPETRTMTPDGFARVLAYEIRVEWTPPSNGSRADPKIVRELQKVNGRPPNPKDKDVDSKCMDPEPVSPEPLAMFLASDRQDYVFSLTGRGKMDGRPTVTIDYRPREKGHDSIKWNEDCVKLDLPGHFRGRVWVDEETADILRMDEALVGTFSFDVPPDKQLPLARSPEMRLEQALTSTRYQPVVFHDPEETLLLPRSVETLNAWNNAGYARVRITQTFSNYRRFVGDSHLVPPP